MLVEILIGFIFIVCGLLVKKHPQLIAGYNSMSIKEKQRINIKKVSTVLHNGFIIIGVLTIIICISMFLLDINILYKLLIETIIIILGLFYTLIKANTP